VGENTEGDVERKGTVLWLVDCEDGDTDVRLISRDGGYNGRESGEASKKSWEMHDERDLFC
jgi:hypothetical protein